MQVEIAKKNRIGGGGTENRKTTPRRTRLLGRSFGAVVKGWMDGWMNGWKVEEGNGVVNVHASFHVWRMVGLIWKRNIDRKIVTQLQRLHRHAALWLDNTLYLQMKKSSRPILDGHREIVCGVIKKNSHPIVVAYFALEALLFCCCASTKHCETQLMYSTERTFAHHKVFVMITHALRI